MHTVELYRQTEGPQGESQLIGPDRRRRRADGSARRRPAGSSRSIGDSITCGYGDLGALADTDCFPTESHWDTYEAVAARALGAEVSTIAASGRGVVRNYGGDTSGTMPMLYARTLDQRAGAASGTSTSSRRRWSSTSGTNDISNDKGDPGRRLSRHVRRRCSRPSARTIPHTFIVCIIAPLLNGSDLTTIEGHIQDAVDMRNAAGDTKVEFFVRSRRRPRTSSPASTTRTSPRT